MAKRTRRSRNRFQSRASSQTLRIQQSIEFEPPATARPSWKSTASPACGGLRGSLGDPRRNLVVTRRYRAQHQHAYQGHEYPSLVDPSHDPGRPQASDHVSPGMQDPLLVNPSHGPGRAQQSGHLSPGAEDPLLVDPSHDPGRPQALGSTGRNLQYQSTRQ